MHIYFSGIGGSGLNPLAHLSLDCGYTVSGSDTSESKNLQSIRERTNSVSSTQDGTHIADVHSSKQPIDWLIYSSSLSEDHPELKFARTNGIRTTKRQDLINHIAAEKNLKLIAIAGTHGKTTTTAMIAWALIQLKIPASFIIGSNIGFSNSGTYQEDSSFLIIEADEYDRTMLSYKPFLSAIVSLDYDHPDIYKTEDEYIEAFNQFASQSKHTITWGSVANLLHIQEPNQLTVLNEENMEPKSNLAGLHNRRNAFLAASVVKQINSASTSAILEAIDSFPGTERRFEEVAANIYSDYAHHPEEIAATIQRALEINENVVVVYQPHQNIRQHKLIGKYDDCFIGAQKVYWLPTYQTREDPNLKVLKPGDIMPQAENIEVADLNEDLFEQITQAASKGSVVIAMGAGDIDSWLRNQLAA